MNWLKQLVYPADTSAIIWDSSDMVKRLHPAQNSELAAISAAIAHITDIKLLLKRT